MAKIFGSFKSTVRAGFDPLGRLLVRGGISADAVTILGTLGVMAGSFIFIPRGQFFAATIVITLCALLDVLDGAMARARGTSTRFGALLDSTMDRVADGALFGALAWYYGTKGHPLICAVALVCVVSGQIVSYVKARAEGLGFTCNVGVAERLERLILIGVGGLISGLGADWSVPAALWLLAFLSVFTVGQRLAHVRAQERTAQLVARAG